MSKKSDDEKRTAQVYDLNADKLHSFFTAYGEITDNYCDIYNLSTQLIILSENLYSGYDRRAVIDCMLSTIRILYKANLEEQKLINECTEIYGDMIHF